MSEVEGMELVLGCANMVAATMGFIAFVGFLANYMARVVSRTNKKISQDDTP